MQIAFVQIYPFEQNSLWASKGEVKELSKKDLIDCFKILEGEPGDKIYLPLIPSYRFIYSFETLGNLSIVFDNTE
jgi:glutathione S-transferase